MQDSKNITNFLEEDFSSSALYLSFRSLPSAIDSLKQSHRKAVYTIKKKNLTTRQKVSQLGPLVAAETDYLHGDVSIVGAITTLAQDYAGANNLPLLVADGNFGTRFSHEPSAPRYIYTYPEPYFNQLFKKEDDANLITQIFEGGIIEPRFFVPTLPLILVNGCTGIGVGFAAKILSRSPKALIKATRDTLNHKALSRNAFTPYFKGFKGTIEPAGDNRWLIKGTVELDKDKLTITEIPVNYSLADYIVILKKLKDRGLLIKYDDLSEEDVFKFKVTLSPEEAKKSIDDIMNDFKLVVPYTESLICLDADNAITEFRSPKELFNYYYQVKLEYLNKRIVSEVERLTKELAVLEEIYKFIVDVIEGTINLKLKRADVETQIKNRGYTLVDKLLNMPLVSITKEKAEEAKEKWAQKAKELEIMKQETPKTLWEKDLAELEKLL